MNFTLPAICLFTLLNALQGSARAENTVEGIWAFKLPDGNPAWLQITGRSEGKLLWSVGSARPVQNLQINDNKISFERKVKWKPWV